MSSVKESTTGTLYRVQPAGAMSFAAAGTLPRPPEVADPGDARRIWLIIEFGLLFIAAPLVMKFAIVNHGVPLFVALPPVFLLLATLLLFDPGFSLKLEFSRGFSLRSAVAIVMLFVIGAAATAGFVQHVMPERFLQLPLERTQRWMKILALYPVTSVLAQEFVYRVFFFHRYGPLFRRAWMLILVNGLVFGFGHIIFRNWIAVAATTVGGFLFAWRYLDTRSFWAVYLEHVLWGWLVFTVGLGVYFFTGVANPSW